MRSIVYLLCSVLLCGCAHYVGDLEIIEELRYPTKFPDINKPEVLNITQVLATNRLGEGDKIKLVPLGETKYASVQLMLVRSGVSVPPHLHKDHDVVIHVKGGSAIVIMNGTHYFVKEGNIILVPRKTWYEVRNTGEEPFAMVNVFYPPYQGEDIKFFKTREKDKKKIKRELEPREVPSSASGQGHGH